MKKGTETEILIDDAGIEVSVTYDWERDYTYWGNAHGYYQFGVGEGGGTEINLTEVMIVIGGKGIDILPQLTQQQRQVIINNLLINQ